MKTVLSKDYVVYLDRTHLPEGWGVLQYFDKFGQLIAIKKTWSDTLDESLDLNLLSLRDFSRFESDLIKWAVNTYLEQIRYSVGSEITVRASSGDYDLDIVDKLNRHLARIEKAKGNEVFIQPLLVSFTELTIPMGFVSMFDIREIQTYKLYENDILKAINGRCPYCGDNHVRVTGTEEDSEGGREETLVCESCHREYKDLYSYRYEALLVGKDLDFEIDAEKGYTLEDLKEFTEGYPSK